ncbi:MAG: FtsX-like permease family protein [bacterium]|nr:FtsX-like permease family protein [bacterium]
MNRQFVSAMARRELRGSGRRLALYGSCMALGIAALVALTGLRGGISEAVASRARALMGADLMLRSQAPLSPAIHEQITALTGGDEADVAHVTSFASMALAETSQRSRLVHVQAVEAGFPFYGKVITEPTERWSALGEGAFAIVDPAVLIQLDTKVGEQLRVGRASFTIRAKVLKAPGTFGLRASVAPRVFIPAAQLDATGLVRQGSMVEYLGYLRSAVDLDAWREAHEPLLRAERTTARTVSGFQEGLSESLATLTRYLGLVGLTALLLGGIGVAAGIRVFVQEKLDTASVLRALGARSGDVIAVYMAQAAALGVAGGLLGVATGYAVQAALPGILASFIPVELTFRPDPAVGVIGFCLGLGVTMVFAAWPLLDLRDVPPLRALRRDVEPATRTKRHLGVPAVIGAALLGATLWQAPSSLVGLAHAAGIGAALLVLTGAATGLTRLLKTRVPQSAPYWLRQGIANLFRPRNQTLATTLTVGFGLFLVASVQLLQSNLLLDLEDDAGPDRANMVLFDVQRDQQDAVVSVLEEHDARVDNRTPMVPARIVALGGKQTRTMLIAAGETPAEEEEERSLRWALRRDYRLTYRADLRDTEHIVAGTWWNAEPQDEGPSPVSLERELAETLGIEVGDSITWDIQGVPIESVVTNLREVDWARFATNFFVVFPPGPLDEAPQSIVLVGHLKGEEARATLQRDLVGAFPNISVLDATLLLRAVATVVRQVSLAVRFMAVFTLATGLIVLLAAASTARFQRIREALLLRTLGCRAATLRRIFTTESLALGVLSASVGLGLAVIAAWALVRFLFEQAFHWPMGDLAILWLATVGLTTALGWSHARPALQRPPLAMLREVKGG